MHSRMSDCTGGQGTVWEAAVAEKSGYCGFGRGLSGLHCFWCNGRGPHPHSLCPSFWQIPTPTPLALAPWGKCAGAGRGMSNTYSELSLIRPNAQGSLAHRLRNDPTPDTAVMTTEERGRPSSYMALALTPLAAKTELPEHPEQRWDLCLCQV